jgi:nucleoside-diphosphate-sugar epimerase
MKYILVTGAAGQVGSCMVDYLVQQQDVFVVAVDNFLTGKKENLPTVSLPNYKFIQCDVNNYEALSGVMLSYKFDYVFHYAAVVGVKRTLEHPLWVLNDIKGIENVLNLSKNTGVERFFFSSSSEVYGEPFEHPQNENTTPLNSKLPYAVVKNVAEAYIRSYQKEFGLDYTIFRFFNTYGPKQSEDFVVKKFIKLALNNEDITLYGDGSQTRTFCFIDDNIRATATCLFENKFVNDTLNIGSDIEMTIKELAELVIKVTGSQSKIEYLPALEEGDMTRRRPDISKMKTLIPNQFTALEAGILNIIKAL